MADLADNLAAAITRAAGRIADPDRAFTVEKVRDHLAADLRDILSTELPAWYAGYQAAQEDSAEAPKFDPVYGHRVYRPDLAPAARPEPPTTVSALLRELAELAEDLDNGHTSDDASEIVRRARAVIVDGIESGEA